MIKMSSENAIKKARVQLLLDSPFFGNLVMNLKIKKMDNLAFHTMAVDDEGNLYYDDAWVESLTPDQLEFVLCHEVLHLAFNHMTRRDNRQLMRWYMSCDFAINSTLVQSNVGQMPTDSKGQYKGLFDAKYNGWCAEHIYNDLPEQPADAECDGDCANCPMGDDADGDGEGVPCPHGKDGKDRKDGQGKDGWSSGGGFDHHKDDSGANAKTSEQKRKELESKWTNMVARAAMSARMQGKLPGNLEQMINGLLYPKVDWRTVLWQFVNKVTKDDYRWYPPNRRHLGNGLYLPSMRAESFELAVAVDTSGSISDEELKQFLSEVQAILEMNPSCTLHFYECDADVHKYREYQAGENIDCTVNGRGGTDFRPVFDDIEKRGLEIPCLVYLTDGYGSYPDQQPNYDVLWILTNDYKVPFGDKVMLDENKTER